MVFTPVTLFRGIACPQGEQCELLNCIFNHELRLKPEPDAVTDRPTEDLDAGSSERPAKRRKITYEKDSDKPRSKAEQIRSELAASRQANGAQETKVTATKSASNPKSLTRPVSPPLLSYRDSHPPSSGSGPNGDNSKRSYVNDNELSTLRHGTKDTVHLRPDIAAHKATPTRKTEASEGLNPRLIPVDPAGHAKRSIFLKYLHAELLRLNRLVHESQALEHKHLLTLTNAELIKMTLDEEEALARSNPQLYSNIIKNRIGHYKKMTVAEWTQHLQIEFKKTPKDISTTKAVKPVETELTPEEEIAILPQLVETNQMRLVPHGYIPTPPTEEKAAQAADAVKASLNYEICERCAARFQVFPDRNKDGLLTSNGPCKHHPDRKRFPPKTKGQIAQGTASEPYYPCCDGKLGSPGCEEKPDHVFKASSPARLAAVLPFITTPENNPPKNDKLGKEVHAVSFDCEMGHTTYGMELIRLTAVTWPAGDALIDVLVRPLGTIIDLNSRFSGVFPEHFTNAVPYEQWTHDQSEKPSPRSDQQGSVKTSLPVVSSPQEARSLLCSYLQPTTPLIGHAIDNDLNAVRLCHPTIVDTVLLFPHPRGLPNRFGLKMLADRHLHRAIQTGGARGHDSLEDAVATGDLVRVKAAEKWIVLRAKGWKLEDGTLKSADGKNGKVEETEKIVNAVIGEKRARSPGA